MADTFQYVGWALERGCRYRQGDGWSFPKNTSEQLGDLRTLTNAISDGRVVENVCVTSWSTVSPFKTDTGKRDYQKSVAIPVSGFRVAQRFAQYGGVESAFATCGICEANAMAKRHSQLAGCHGHLSVAPQSKELEALLRQSLSDLGLATKFFELFQETNPIWYGLWIESPLRAVHASILWPVLQQAFANENEKRTGMGHFLRALEITIKLDMPLHVELAPLGHTDLGWYTIFPHCPRCKATARVGRWKEEYSCEDYVCQVCGHHFIPDDTHSQEEMNWDLEAASIEKQLGFEEFSRFVRKYAESQGYTVQQAEAAWEEELKSRETIRRAAAANQKKWKSNVSKEEAVALERLAERGKLNEANNCLCPKCGVPLRTNQAKQCFKCGADWH